MRQEKNIYEDRNIIFTEYKAQIIEKMQRLSNGRKGSDTERTNKKKNNN